MCVIQKAVNCVFESGAMFVCRELSRFIASNRLHCRIDKVGGVVETNRPDSKNFLYQVCTYTHRQ